MTSYVAKDRTVRLPTVTDLQINSFNTGMINVHGSYIKNGVIRKYPSGTFYVTQRPGFSIFNSPSDASVTDVRGRGIYYWEEVPALYFVNNDTVYKTDYTGDLAQLISAGAHTVNIAELGDKLVFLDHENNEMWYIDSDTSTTLRSMNPFTVTRTDISFTNPSTISTVAGDFSVLSPGDIITITSTSGLNDGTYTVVTASASTITVSETTITTETAAAAGTVVVTRTNFNALPQNNSLFLAHGIVVLDQTMYVLDSSGRVWGSAVANILDWDNALNYITAEKEEDVGVAIEKHYNNLVVFGRRTIEFMYDAGNPTGSPLSVRDDISYNIGLVDPHSVWRNGDDIYFLGIDTVGQIQPYLLREWRIAPINSEGDLSSFITTTASIDGINAFGAGCSSGGETFYILTIYNLDDDDNPISVITLVYNSNTQTWSEWEFAGSGIDNFPLVGYTITDSARIGEGIFATGELCFLLDNFTPFDSIGIATDPYVTSGYVGSDYVLSGTSANSDEIDLIVRLDNWDNGNRDWKFMHQLRYVGDETADPNTLTVKWNDGNNVPESYTHSNTIDVSNGNNKITRLGKFKSRSFEFEYSGNEQIRFEAIDVDISEGTH
jgi:hypothetical protein